MSLASLFVTSTPIAEEPAYSTARQVPRIVFSRDVTPSHLSLGILLRKFVSEGTLEDVSHVLVDEVHERTVEMDLLLLLLKKLLEKSTTHRSKIHCPKIVLMSATANAQEFQAYFSKTVSPVPFCTFTPHRYGTQAGNVPILNIPGFTFPVREFYMEQIHQALDTARQSAQRSGWEMDDAAAGGGDAEMFSHHYATKKKKNKEETQVSPLPLHDTILRSHIRSTMSCSRSW